MNKLVNFEEADLYFQIGSKLSCTVVNPDHSGDNPAPIYTSQNLSNPEHLNKLTLQIKNLGTKLALNVWPLEADLPTNADGTISLNKLSYIRFNFSDFVDQKFISRFALSVGAIENTFLEFVEILKVPEQLGLFVRPNEDNLAPTIWILRCARNVQRIAKLEETLRHFYAKKEQLEDTNLTANESKLINNVNAVIAVNEELNGLRNPKNLMLDKYDVLDVAVQNLISFVRPSLRYLDVSWKNDDSKDSRALVQSTVVLKRPSYFVEPPFPLEIFWLNNHNVAYISKTDENETQEIENELSFGISNKGLKPLTLDCRQEVREGPYFELVFLGGAGVGDATQDKYIKDIQLRIQEDEYGNKWIHHKMIHGPVITWRIEPRMYTDGKRNKIILGIEEAATITFSLSDLKVVGAEGVSMLYLRYYNIPDFDDNQIVLYIEKKKPTGSMPSAGFEQKYLSIEELQPDENEGVISKNLEQKFITPPLRWKMDMGEYRNETSVILGDKVGIGRVPTASLEVQGSAMITDTLQLGNKKITVKTGVTTSDFFLCTVKNNEFKKYPWVARAKVHVVLSDGYYFSEFHISMTAENSYILKEVNNRIDAATSKGAKPLGDSEIFIRAVEVTENGQLRITGYNIKFNGKPTNQYWIELESLSASEEGHPELL